MVKILMQRGSTHKIGDAKRTCATILVHHGSYLNLSSAQHSGASSRRRRTTTMIKEDADYGSDQTQHTCKGRRGDGNGCSGAPVCSADWARRSWHVLLRKRPRS